jgi:hypothetical protein
MVTPPPPPRTNSIGDADGRVGRVNLNSIDFDALPPELIVRAFGVDYGHIRPPEGGDLYVTRYGWPYAAQLLPANWFSERWYVEKGERLPGSTGTVYHVMTRPVRGRSADLVVKFSRMAQDVPVEVATSFPDDVPTELIASARVNSPLEEFGLVMEIRRGIFGPPDPRILTQRPLAIYAPPDEYQLWQLGRNQGFFQTHHRLLAEDQENAAKAIELDIRRIYVLLYGWIKGKDAEEFFLNGEISEANLRELTPRVVSELRLKGFRVLDNKPKHFILRKGRLHGDFLRRRDGQLVYGLVDFEFLQRTPEHRKQFKAGQRRRYWSLQSHRPEAPWADFPTHLKPAEIFGVPYVFGAVPDGGRVWVVGRDPGLFDYFLPDRWRRTPRVKLSLANEVYRTRTRDSIHMVYRRSRVGIRPRIDPLMERDRRVRDHGFNSPFEEVAIAEQLRQMGIRTTHPRAICRTGHFSTKALFIRDLRRFEDHALILTPDQDREPIMSPNYDYYTIWDHFRGVDPGGDSGCANAGLADLGQLHDDGVVDESTSKTIAERAHHRLQAIGLIGGCLESHEIMLHLDNHGRPLRDAAGEPLIKLCVDALTAYENELLNEQKYRDLMTNFDERLKAVDCEILNPSGSHLLLSMDPDGRFQVDERGDIAVTLCNFELIRGLYRPFR